MEDTKKEVVTKVEQPKKVVDEGSEIAKAITDGLKQAKNDNFTMIPEEGINHRFTVVKNKQGEVFLRENESGVLSKVQLESIEEKEASIQGQEVTEV